MTNAELGVGLVRLEREADRSAWVFAEPERFVHWDWSQCSRWDARYADVLQGEGERTTGERTFHPSKNTLGGGKIMKTICCT